MSGYADPVKDKKQREGGPLAMIGYRTGYRVGRWIGRRVPMPIALWYGRRKGWVK